MLFIATHNSARTIKFTIHRWVFRLVVGILTTMLWSSAVIAQGGSALNEIAKLMALDGAASDRFGYALDMSGNTIVVGAMLDADNGGASGSAYVYVHKDNGTWTQQAKLLPSNGAAFDRFGTSVAISGDTIVVGANGNDDNGLESGTAYVFTRDDAGVWTQKAILTPSDAWTGDQLGGSVDISRNKIIIGAQSSDPNGSISGSAYIFVRDTIGAWTQQTKLLPNDGQSSDAFGSRVAIRNDMAIVAATGDDDNGSNAGSAYIFERNSLGAWMQQFKLLASDGNANDRFGVSVDILGDTAVVGASTHSNNGARSGAVYIFVSNANGQWAEQAELLASDGESNDYFGVSVGMSGDAVVIGASNGNDDNGIDSGSAYVFTRRPLGHWKLKNKLLATDAAFADQFGYSIAISGDKVLVGAKGDDDNGLNSGSAYIIDLNQGSPADLNGDGFINGSDLAALLAQWGSAGSADLNNDGVVDAADLAFLLSNWGAAP